MKNLVIVESPAKGNTIKKFLGSDYEVVASMGHIRDLPEKQLGIDIENNFTPTYDISTGKKKVVDNLKKLAKKADEVWLATDEDREGEAIAWHLAEALNLDVSKTKRIVFHEITKNALLEAIKTPRLIAMDLVNAQQSRRLLDRLVGFQVSPVLWKKIQKGLSAGRVQSVAVKLIVEREREITAFIPQESWKIKALLNHETTPFLVELAKVNGKNPKVQTAEDMEKLLEFLGGEGQVSIHEKKKTQNVCWKIAKNFVVESIIKKDGKRTPQAPFTTSTLQQEASRKLGYSVKQTMSLAQQLYQNGHITYMRTDSVNLSKQAIDGAKEYIDAHFGSEYGVEGGRSFTNKQANAQEAHEAIRPTNLETTAGSLDVSPQEAKLYQLIWERTIASQMKDAIVATTTFSFKTPEASDYTWQAQGEVIVFSGFMKLYTESDDEEKEEKDNPTLPALSEGQEIPSREFRAEQNFSRPPSRYTEAMLVKRMESEGIGRPSTYAPTITTIIDRGYVEKEEKKLKPTAIAFTVNDFLQKHFTDLMDYKFTAKIEEELDEISHGKIEWTDMLGNFYVKFKEYLDNSQVNAEKVVEFVGRKCPECEEGDLIYKFSRGGKFVGCSRYPECKYLESNRDEKEEALLQQMREEYEGKPCPDGGDIVVKTGRFGPFLASSLYPKVKWTQTLRSLAQNTQKEELEAKYGKPCDKCEKPMVIKFSRRGPFLACSGYPECKNALSLPKEALEKKEDEGKSEEE